MPAQTAMRSPDLPRVLLVEDDPISRAFLGSALRAVPVEVDSADSVAAATALGKAHAYALWLFDARLPDGDGAALLARLRALQPRVPAIAHTASGDADVRAALREAGFAEVLVKPLPATILQAAVRRVLGPDLPAATDGAPAVLWDDGAAAVALNGNHAHVDMLRGLFLGELPQARERIAVAARAGDVDGLRGELHRLRASCGFVGAARLGVAVHALQQQPESAGLLERFDEIARATLAQPGQTSSL